MKKITMQLAAGLLCAVIASPLFADTHIDAHYKDAVSNWWSPSRLYMGAYAGYGDIDGSTGVAGQSVAGRLSLGIHAIEYSYFSVGAEIGAQSGTDMPLYANSTVTTAVGGLPIQATLKPIGDLLLTVKGQFSNNYPIFGILKGGIAYRQLLLDSITSSRDDLRKINGELQVGLGFDVTQHAMLTLLYQGIYAGSNANVQLDSSGDVTIGRIPTQQFVFLGIDYSF